MRALPGQPTKTLLALARELRQRQTPAEEVLWALLRDRRFRGVKFRRQAAVGGFVADFLCRRLKLVIEVDGGVHDTAAQRDRDENRDGWLQNHGYKVLRFPNEMVLDQPEEVLRQLDIWLRE